MDAVNELNFECTDCTFRASETLFKINSRHSIAT